MKYFEYSNIGNRTSNQDFVLSTCTEQNNSSFIVADGMGGYQEGALAAKIVAEVTLENLNKGFDIAYAIGKANEKLSLIKEKLSVQKMGCCIAGIQIKDNIGHIFWCGDSRVYLFRNKELLFKTEDHSLIAKLEKQNKLTSIQKRRYEHVVYRAIMGEETDIVDEREVILFPDDEIFICSDGIYKKFEVLSLLNLMEREDFDLTEHNTKFEDNHSFIYIRF